MLPKVRFRVLVIYHQFLEAVIVLTVLSCLGRLPRSASKAGVTSSAVAQSRLNRRNNAKQGQMKKRQELVSAARIFNGADGAPRIVAVIPLTKDVHARSTVSALSEALDTSADDCPETGLWKLRFVVVFVLIQFSILNIHSGPQGGTLQNISTIHKRGLPRYVCFS
jgi:hypothetical protein